MNISGNPWTFTSADVVTATPSASRSGLISSAGGIVALTTGAAHGLLANQYATVIGATNSAYNLFYKVLAVPTATTAKLFANSLFITGTILAASGGGTIILVQYPYMIRGEDLSWQNATAAGELKLLDRNGNIIWDAIAPTTGNYSRSKPYWIEGIAAQAIPSGTVVLTVN